MLDTETLVIADAEKPSAIAGLMGSEWSEVTDETTTVLMECANFDGPSTQALLDPARPAHRGIEPVGEGARSAPAAAARCALASQLMVELAGARLVPGTIDLHGELPEPPVVPLRRERLEEPDRRRLHRRRGRPRARPGSATSPTGGGWRVPTWRAADTTREIDLIEEVARVVRPRAGADRDARRRAPAAAG